MIFKDIAEYEDTDSDLAKFTISQLHSKIDYLQDKIKELEANNDIEGIYQCDEEGFEWIDKKTYDALYEKVERLNKELSTYKYRPKTRFRDVIELRDRINKAIELLKKYNDKESNYYVPVDNCIDILKGVDKE